ncbi:MAG: alpha/beta fold hydrolase [Acidobacteria bacterium]|nr:alpha/beta fold hydrolase [Acidobacteriota bacterium]
MFEWSAKRQSVWLVVWLVLICHVGVRITAKVQQSEAQAVESWLTSAVRDFEANRISEAKIAFEKIIKSQPQHPQAAFYLGRIAFQQKQTDDAIRWFELAVQQAGQTSSFHHWLAQAYGSKARTGSMLNRANFAGKAKDELLKAVSLEPANLPARADLARYYNEVPAILGGSQEKAFEQVEAIKKQDPLQGWLLAGDLWADKRNVAEAERAYRAAETQQTNKFEATMKLGALFQRAQNFDRAFAEFEKVVKAQPDHFAALYQIGRTAGMSGRQPERGLAAFAQVKQQLPPNDRDALIGYHWWRGRILEAKGDLEQARAEYETLERISPGHPDTRAALERVKPKETITATPNLRPGLVALAPSSLQANDGEVMDCEYGRLLVPENRQVKSSRLIELVFLRFKTSAAKPQAPVVFLAGGPGGSGLSTGRVTEFFQTIKALRAVSDVILLDQRGTGGSLPSLGCPGTIGDLPAHALRSRADAVQAFADAAQRCADQLRAQGVDFAGYTILTSADDVEDLRRALRVEKVSLWGHSYGTQLALATVRRYPQSIERMILMGVESVASTQKWPGDTDRYFAELAELVKNDPRIGQSMPDLLGSIRRVLAKFDHEPLTVSLPNPAINQPRELIVGGFGLRAVTLLTILNDTRNLPLIPLLYASLEKNDLSVLREMLTQMQARNLFTASLYLIDGASGATADRRAQIEREAQTALFADVANFPFPDINRIWQPKDLGDAFRQPVKSAVPTLLISGTLDANTPPHRAEEVRQGLSRAAHLIVENAGHQDHLRAAGLSAEIVRFVSGEHVSDKRFVLPKPEFVPLVSRP